MGMIRNCRHRSFAGTNALVALVVGMTVMAALSMAPSASAGLMSYDVMVTGHMSPNNGTNIEQYGASNIVPNVAVDASLPNTISPTPNPSPFTSASGRTNRSRTSIVFADLPAPNGNPVLNREIWLLGPLTDPSNLFVNDLLSSEPVEVNLALRFDDLPAGQKVVVSDVVLADATNKPAQSVEVLSGVGSVANPLNLLIKFSPSDVETSGTQIKMQFDYGTMIVPEPATLGLVSLGCLGIVGLIRRRSR
jgi:hypothetical protein